MPELKQQRIPGIECVCASGPLLEGGLDLPFLVFFGDPWDHEVHMGFHSAGGCHQWNLVVNGGSLPWQLPATLHGHEVDISVRLIQSQTVRSLSG